MATMRTVPVSASGGAPSEYWRVSIEHSTKGHTIAPFMDRPRVFQCPRHEAETEFKAFYGILSTPHIITVEPVTEADLIEQEAAEKKRSNVPYSAAWVEWLAERSSEDEDVRRRNRAFLEDFRQRRTMDREPQAA